MKERLRGIPSNLCNLKNFLINFNNHFQLQKENLPHLIDLNKEIWGNQSILNYKL